MLGIGILPVRRNVPESPRWMFIHGKAEEADELVTDIERQVKESAGVSELKEPKKSIKVREQERVGFFTIAKTVFGAYPRRTVVGSRSSTRSGPRSAASPGRCCSGS